MRKRWSAVAALALTAAALALLEAQGPQFEAAVFHLNTTGSNESSVQQRPGGQYVMVNGTIATLLLNAFRPENREIVNAPAWVTSDQYDTTARGGITTSR